MSWLRQLWLRFKEGSHKARITRDYQTETRPWVMKPGHKVPKLPL